VPRIAEETIQRVVEANDIVEVINSYFPLKRAGTSFRALCPFHKEKSPSFHVNPQRQSFHCFGCGAGGSVIRFVMDYEHLDFPGAVRRLAQKAGVNVIEEAGTPQDDETHNMRRRLLALHADATAWFQQQLLRTAPAQVAREYLKSRGITVEVAKSWQLGYAPDSWDALLDFLRAQRYSREEIAQSGLAASRSDDERGDAEEQHMYARFRGRVIFPICNDYGEVIAFSGRVLDAEARTAKYVNSPETPIFRKGRVFYGFHKSKRALIEAGAAIVCEGQLDLISAYEHGVQNVIAPQGTAFTPEQARLLSRFVKTVILCFDSDRAGQEAVTRSLPALMECDMEVRVARLPDGQDPDSLIRGQGPEAFREAIGNAKNFFDHALDRMVETGAIDDPMKKAAAARRLGPFVAAIKDKVLREATASKISARLQMAIASFATHMVVSRERSAEEEAPEVVNVAPLVLDQGIRLLCRHAILNAEARSWLSTQITPHLAELGAGGELLEKIVRSPLALEEPGGMAAFLAGLNRSEELAINGLDLKKPLDHILAIAQNDWFGLARNHLVNQRAATESQLHQANLSGTERNRLQSLVAEISKQILDLQSRLNEV
jgi:DNA primase